MVLNMKATIGGDLSGVMRGILVLLVVLALSWAAVNHRVSRIEQRHLESPAVADPTITETEGAEKEEQNEDENDEAQEPIPDWEAAHAAAESGDLSKIRFLILDRGLHVDAEDNHAMTLLQVASRHGHLEIVRFLIDNGATVNAVEIDSRSALHFATIRGHLSIVRFLLENKADVNLRKRLGLTPLHVVTQHSKQTDLVRVLLDHGADIEAPDDRGDTPLDWAITFGSGVMVQELLRQGAILRGRDADGKRPMERAVRGWDWLKVDVLAKNGQHFPANQKDMQRVMMLYEMNKDQIKDESGEILKAHKLCSSFNPHQMP